MSVLGSTKKYLVAEKLVLNVGIKDSLYNVYKYYNLFIFGTPWLLISLKYCFSDGENVVNCVTLKPSCNITFNKTEWKKINSKKSPEKVLEHYNYPILKIIDFELAQNESTSVIVLTKIKERLYIWKVCDYKI